MGVGGGSGGPIGLGGPPPNANKLLTGSTIKTKYKTVKITYLIFL